MTHRFGQRPTPVAKGPLGLGESQGLRARGPAPVSSETAPSGAPKSKKNQRGKKKTPMEQALDAIQDAKQKATDPVNDKAQSNLP